MPSISADAAQKFQNSLLQEFHQTLLRALKLTVGNGYPQQLLRLYSTMFHEWHTLQKDVTDVMEAVAALDWTVAPYVPPGGEPTPAAQELASTVSAALWHPAPAAPGTFAHTLTDMIGAALDGIYRGISVHEIIWARDEREGLIYPAEYRQVAPQYFMWETREGHADRLLLVPDGYDYTAPVPFPEHKFVIALNTIGSDHPIFNATFYSLISYFMAAKFGLPWMQDFCSRYGHPMRTFHVQNARDEEQLRAALQEAPDVHDIFLHPERSVEITPIPAAAGNPHEVLLRVAENACHQAILGQTLTSDTSENGGSRAQAQVHLGVQKAIVQKRAEYVARVLNRQLIPAIVRLNYGHTDGLPLPELRYSLQDEAQNAARAEYWSKVLAIPGMRVAADVVYESLRIPQPAADEENVLSTPENTAAAAPTTAAAAAVKKNAEYVLAADEGTEETDAETPRRPSILNRAALASTLAELFRTAYVGDDAPEKTTAAHGECRSKDPEHCRVHGTPGKKKSPWTPARRKQYDIYHQKHKQIKENLVKNIPQKTGDVFALPHIGLQNVCVTRSSMGEMLGIKAVKTTILNGCPAEAHFEAASQYKSTLQHSTRGESMQPTKKERHIKEIIPLSAPFTASDKKNYTAIFRIHIPVNAKEPNKVYFMNLEKAKKSGSKPGGRTSFRNTGA